MKAAIAALVLGFSVNVLAQHEPARPAPWLVAQDRRMPTCKVDERDVPVGTTTCRQGQTYVCSGRGAWEGNGKPC